MILSGAARTLVGGAASAATTAASMVKHVAWYVAYQVNGTARDPDKRS
ncbi:MAG: hypothetical protein H0V29_11245 [Thermoleophilaceae bacterium]|nr:hypothetical protein [Thermoleophilaceae bacterium]